MKRMRLKGIAASDRKRTCHVASKPNNQKHNGDHQSRAMNVAPSNHGFDKLSGIILQVLSDPSNLSKRCNCYWER